MYQRQLSKEGLQSLVNNAAGGGGVGGAAAGEGAAADAAPDITIMSSEDLRDLFTLRMDTLSDTYDSMCGTKAGGAAAAAGGDDAGRTIVLDDSDSDGGGEEGGAPQAGAGAPVAAAEKAETEVAHKPQVRRVL